MSSRTTENIIDSIAEKLVKVLSESSVFNFEDIKTIVQTHLKVCMYEIIREHSNKLQFEKIKLLEKLNNTTNGYVISKLQKRISTLNIEIKTVNKAVSSCKEISDFKLVCKYVEEKYGSEALERLFAYLNSEKVY
jgi:predicted RecB family endonuclease